MSTITTAALAITEPGVYDLTPEEYHSGPVARGSLSSGGARALLPPSCPAKFAWQRDNPRPPKREFDLGHAAHLLVLGAGPELVVIDHGDYRTKDAKAQRDEAHLAGAVPLLAHEYEQVSAMATALRAHPLAAALFDNGRPERSLFWRDDRTGVWRRARPDWLPDPRPGRRVLIGDYKTCHSADPDALARAVHQFGYHQQADWYLAGCRALGLAGDDAAFVFVCQEKAPPYLVSVVDLDHVAMRIGAERNRRAIDIYAHCEAAGEWPPYVEGVHLLSLPPWAERAEGEGQP